MKIKSSLTVCILALLVVFFSCSEDNSDYSNIEPEAPPAVADTYNYIALRSDGTLFKIGNKTGTVSKKSNVPNLETNVIFNAITSSTSKIYICSHRFDLSRTEVFTIDRKTWETKFSILNFPEDVYGEAAGLTSLNWDEANQTLIGTVVEDFEAPHNDRKIKIIRIDPETLLFEDQNIDLSQEDYWVIFSSTLVKGILYASISKDKNVSTTDFVKIDLKAKTYSKIAFGENQPTLYNLGNNGDPSAIFGFEPITGTEFIGNTSAVTINIESSNVTRLSDLPRISSLNNVQKSFYDKNEKIYVQFVFSEEGLNLLKYKPENGELGLTAISNPEDLSSLITLIDIEEF